MSRAKAVFIPPAELVVVARSSYPKEKQAVPHSIVCRHRLFHCLILLFAVAAKAVFLAVADALDVGAMHIDDHAAMMTEPTRQMSRSCTA